MRAPAVRAAAPGGRETGTGGRADRPVPRGRTEVVLASVPGLGGLYARGVGTSARHAVATRLGRAPGALPDVVYAVHGLRADADHLTAYQHLLGESASDVLPAGFVHVLAFPVAMALMVRADFPLPLAGMVHLANRVEQLRPVALDESLDVRAYARDLRPHRKGAQVEVVTEVRAGRGPQGSELAWRGTSTYLSPGTHLDPDRSAPARAGDGGRSDTWVAPVPTGQWRLHGDTGRRYAAVSGDRNPIHLSALTARALGFPRTIAHGMYTASRALAGVGAARTDAFTWTVQFASPVLLPGTVTVRIAADDDPARGFGFTGWNTGSGRVHFTGAVVPR